MLYHKVSPQSTDPVPLYSHVQQAAECKHRISGQNFWQKHCFYILQLAVHTVQRNWIRRLGRYLMCCTCLYSFKNGTVQKSLLICTFFFGGGRVGQPLTRGYYNRNNPLVEGVPPYIHRPSPARWRPVNMWGLPFYQGIISVVTWVPPLIYRPQIFRSLRPGPHLFPCSSMHWTTVFCIWGQGLLIT